MGIEGSPTPPKPRRDTGDYEHEMTIDAALAREYADKMIPACQKCGCRSDDVSRIKNVAWLCHDCQIAYTRFWRPKEFEPYDDNDIRESILSHLKRHGPTKAKALVFLFRDKYHELDIKRTNLRLADEGLVLITSDFTLVLSKPVYICNNTPKASDRST